MSLGSISRPKRISDAQFAGDLMGLFKRHRIESGDPGGAASFESCLATKDNFRSQLFTLCTAISHMADADLCGEELLTLIARALGMPEASDGAAALPESMRTAFLTGYEAWSNRTLNEPDTWPPVREPAGHAPIPFPQPVEGDGGEFGETETHAPDLRGLGTRTVQEALLMARKQTPFELPARSAPSAGVNIENLTISELTKLLEDIERRMSRVKPHFQELNGLGALPDVSLERANKARDFGDANWFRAAAQIGPSLVAPTVGGSISPVETAGIAAPRQAWPMEAEETKYKEDSFLERHAYLKPGRRLPPDMIVPMPTTFAVAPPPLLVEHPVGEVLAPPGPPAAAVSASVAEPDRFRIRIQTAILLIAAVLMVASPLAGLVVYRLLHPTYIIDYRDFNVPVQPDAGSATPAPPAPSAIAQPPAVSPARASAGKASGPRANAAASGAKTVPGTAHATKRTEPVAGVWPPPPQK